MESLRVPAQLVLLLLCSVGVRGGMLCGAGSLQLTCADHEYCAAGSEGIGFECKFMCSAIGRGCTAANTDKVVYNPPASCMSPYYGAACPNSMDCSCVCKTGFAGDLCDTCADGYKASGADCNPVCTIAASCNSHASDVTWSAGDVCTCTCDTGFAQPTCNTCKANYINYPTCTECTNPVHCNNLATTVADDGTRTSCVCTCPLQFSGSTCDSCSKGYINYPTCTQCTKAANCNSHADTVTDDGTRTTCVCTCSNKWTGGQCQTCPAKYGGADCNQCAVKHIGYPTCTECTDAVNCNTHSSDVTDDGTRTSCKCTCRNQWSGDSCETCLPKFGGTDCNKCAAKHVDYPTCTECTIPSSCSNHADSVKTDIPQTACVCTCSNKWTGDKCQTCPAKYGGSACDKCAANYIDYPTCTECTNDVHCNSHASSVADDGMRTACVCTCATGFTGDTCNKCAENYVNYPTCTKCTKAAHCNNHASSVADDGMRTACVCTCAAGFTGDTCDKCAADHIDYPTCTECTIPSSCSNHADSVKTDTPQTACVCTCSNKWTGDKCQTCPTKYGGSACDKCAANYIDYPTCTECTNDVHCNSHASSVADDGMRTACVCTCATGFTGDTCNKCLEDHINYPTCTECTNSAHCNNHAVNVADDGTRTSCVCTCSNKWTGGQCQTCPAKYGGNKCNKCAVKHINYPTCTECTDAVNCNGRSSSVDDDGTRTSCKCTCRNQWSGDSCETCLPKFGGTDCNKCAAKHVDYPTCTECTIPSSCSNHADSVKTDTPQTACVCTCSNKWTGDKCQTCPAKYGGSACDKCAANYIDYPTCTECTNDVHCNSHASSVADDGMRKACVCTCATGFTGDTCNKCAVNHINYPTCTECTKSAHCNNHASSVADDGMRTACVCTCSNKWTGGQCQTCPAKYGGNKCNKCAMDHITYPTCTECTIADHCSGHASAVADDGQRQSCACTCNDAWEGSACQTCSVVYEQTQCKACVANRITYPTCTQCTSKKHCSDHAASVADDGTRSSCSCTCRNEWKGTTCETCDVKHANDCSECAQGYIKPFPACVQCDPDVHCSSHALSVDDDGTRTFCRCECRNQWSGSKCETCDPKYAGSDCNECAGSGINYPICGECTVVDDCSNHATDVKSDASKTSCTCTCRNKWTSSKCETCTSEFSGSDCNECAVGHVNYDTCRQCTIPDDCSGHASGVNDDGTRTSCVCACLNQWVGGKCETCPVEYGGTNCDTCAVGRINYPNCTECTNTTHCNDRATHVTDDGVRGSCQCTCRNKWSGAMCQTCDSNFNGSDCNECAPNHINYDTCEPCSLMTHCSNHADSVVDDGTRTECKCSCRNEWSGNQCEQCVAPHGGSDCNECAVGHITYPNCTECTIPKHCSNHASSVSDDGNRQTCSCVCDNQWTGANCSVCPPNFAGPNCDQCAVGHIDYAGGCIECTIDAHCNGHADGVSDDNRTTCVCNCSNQWTGDVCKTCPLPYTGALCNQCVADKINYPTCTQCEKAVHCNGNALNVEPNAAQSACECTCNDRWTGLTCKDCPSKYNDTNCNKCKDGFIDYPTCSECTLNADCNGHADSVTNNGPRDACMCTCRNQWTGLKCETCDSTKYGGADCDECAQGHKNYPLCGDACHKDYNCSGHANSVKFNAADGTCSCACTNQWTGAACDVCDKKYSATCDFCTDNHINYPACTQCNISTSCKGRATAVTTDAAHTVCKCTCTDFWKGSQCDQCDAGMDATCSTCADGWKGVAPICEECTSVKHCSNHADNVTGDNTTCICSCRNQWTDATCGTCPTKYAGTDCDQCAPSLMNYPSCVPMCELSNNCSHALSVEWVAPSSCKCNCEDNWKGDACGTCELNYNQTTCAACAEGHIAYPFCFPCSNDGNCNGNADVVSDDGTRSTCVCNCSGQYTGTSCDVCPKKYGGAKCDKCATGYINYPDCDQCTQLTCSNHADAVGTNANQTACECTCSNKWDGDICESCPDQYSGANCDECAGDGVKYPACGSPCTVEANCSSSADSVRFVSGSCVCSCSSRFAGKQCDTCAHPYGGSACDECLPGFFADPFPLCVECTSEAYCSGHADNVTDDGTRDHCVCSCRDKWFGLTCNNCDAMYGGDCNACTAGLVGFPDCRACDLMMDCNAANTESVNAVNGSCACECRNMWNGGKCETCPPHFDAKQDCGACEASAPGVYPDCSESTTPTLTLTISLTSNVTPTATNYSAGGLEEEGEGATPTPTLTLGGGFGAADGEDDSCWTAFKGLCFWLLFIGCILVTCCLVVAAVLYRKKKQEEQEMEDRMGFDTLANYCNEDNAAIGLEAVDQPAVEEMQTYNFRDQEGAVNPEPADPVSLSGPPSESTLVDPLIDKESERHEV